MNAPRLRALVAASKEPTPEPAIARVRVVRGAPGLSVYINDLLVAGPMQWGGGTALETWSVPRDMIEQAIARKP